MQTNLVLHSCRPENKVYEGKIERNFAFVSKKFWAFLDPFTTSNYFWVRGCIFGFEPDLISSFPTLI